MSHAALFGEEYSYLVPLLLYKKGNGLVHSIFANGINIKMGDSLVFIGNKKNGLLPFGIHLHEADIRKMVSTVNPKEPVFWNAEAKVLEFPDIHISLEQGQSFKNETVPLTSNPVFESSLQKLISALSAIDGLTGLDVNIQQFIQKFNHSGEKKWQGTEAYLIMLINVAMSNDEFLIEKVLRYFLGRGKGLTPSGDDMLVGLLAFDAVTHFISPLFYQKLSELLENEPITTDVGKEYLRYALKHEFSSTVTDLLNQLAGSNDTGFEAAFYNLLGVGHSSGLDTLFGILVGMLTFKNPNEQ